MEQGEVDRDAERAILCLDLYACNPVGSGCADYLDMFINGFSPGNSNSTMPAEVSGMTEEWIFFCGSKGNMKIKIRMEIE